MPGRFCALGMSLPLGLCKQGPTPTQGMMALTPAMLDRELDNRHLGHITLAMASGDENVDPARQLLPGFNTPIWWAREKCTLS